MARGWYSLRECSSRHGCVPRAVRPSLSGRPSPRTRWVHGPALYFGPGRMFWLAHHSGAPSGFKARSLVMGSRCSRLARPDWYSRDSWLAHGLVVPSTVMARSMARALSPKLARSRSWGPLRRDGSLSGLGALQRSGSLPVTGPLPTQGSLAANGSFPCTWLAHAHGPTHRNGLALGSRFSPGQWLAHPLARSRVLVRSRLEARSSGMALSPRVARSKSMGLSLVLARSMTRVLSQRVAERTDAPGQTQWLRPQGSGGPRPDAQGRRPRPSDIVLHPRGAGSRTPGSGG
jgi:hypothetical protein